MIQQWSRGICGGNNCFGNIKGVYAGVGGNRKAIVSAINLQPEILIADI